MLIPFLVIDGIAPLLATDPLILGGQVLSQGVLSGVVALICYGAAVARLGASRAAVFSALAPALAALIAIPVLGEIPTVLTVVGIGLAVVGVALGSGAVKLGSSGAAFRTVLVHLRSSCGNPRSRETGWRMTNSTAPLATASTTSR